MKRFLMIVLLSVLVTGVSGCSCGGLSGSGCGSPFGNIGGNLGSSFGSNIGSSLGSSSQSILPSLSDGPVRRWLRGNGVRGDSCDTCNVPSGQTSFDVGFDSTCETGLCNAPIGENVFGAPIPSAVSVPTPVTTGYAPVYDSLPLETTAPTLDAGYLNAPVSAPYSSPDVYGGSSVYGGTSDGLVIPPLGNLGN